MWQWTSLVKRIWIPIEILSILLVSPTELFTWSFSQQALHPVAWAQSMNASQVVKPIMEGDLEGNGRMECLDLRSERLFITDCNGKNLWQSPAEWQVKEAQVGDLNRDGKPEAVLLVWRPFRPWPIDRFLQFGGRINDFHNQAGFSCQVILIGWERSGYNELWAGSALIQPVSHLHAVDLDGDGWQELVALEGLYDLEENGGYLTVWKWNGFGFTLEDQVKQKFSQIQIIGSNNQKWAIVQK